MSEAAFFSCQDGTGEWRVFAQFDEGDDYVRNLSAMLNEVLGEIGISVRAVTESAARSRHPDSLGRLQEQWETWQHLCRLYEEGIHEDFPNVFPVQFQAWQSLLKLLEEVDAETLRLPSDETRVNAIERSGGKKKANDEWCFNTDPPEGSKFKYGPLRGQLQQIVHALGQNVRTIKEWNGKTTHYIRKAHSRLYIVWFDSQVIHATVKNSLPES